MNKEWVGEKCHACKKGFTLMGWVDRHEDNEGSDERPDVKNYHQRCCPSCKKYGSVAPARRR